MNTITLTLWLLLWVSPHDDAIRPPATAQHQVNALGREVRIPECMRVAETLHAMTPTSGTFWCVDKFAQQTQCVNAAMAMRRQNTQGGDFLCVQQQVDVTPRQAQQAAR